MDKYIPLSKAYHNLYKLEEVRSAEWGAKRFTTEDIENLFEESVEDDIAPIMHGKWEFISSAPWYLKCPYCGSQLLSAGIAGGKANYCPNCGAKMDGKP